MLGWNELARLSGWPLAAGLAAVLAAGMLAGASWKNSPRGQLAWDGVVWRWASASYQTGLAEYELSVIADTQRCLLLRLENQAGASLWLWAQQQAAPARWLDLRRAVYSPRRASRAARVHDLLLAEPSSSVSSAASAVAVSTAMNAISTPPAKP